MTQKFGDFIDKMLGKHEYLRIAFSPSSISLKERWRNNGLSADFMADYFITFFPSSDTQAEVKSAVSFIANELLENAMKFNDDTSDHPIKITLQLHKDRLVFLAINSINSQAVGKFQAYIQELLTCDPGELYIRQLEKNAEDQTQTASRLGLLTIMNDYQVKMGWKFETVQNNPEVITVSTMVQLIV